MNGIYLATAYVALQYLAAGTMGLLASLNPMLTALWAGSCSASACGSRSGWGSGSGWRE
jgi:drug/metabolite transporter (DMT)-like permease